MSEPKPIKSLLSKIKIEYLIVIVLAIICMCIIFGGTKSEKQVSYSSEIDNYVANLENKLKSNLSMVSGAGKVSVIISVKSGMENVVATIKTDKENITTEEPLIIGGKPVVLSESFPKINGVVIVAQGANNLSVRIQLINATAVFLNIENEKIQVLPMK